MPGLLRILCGELEDMSVFKDEVKILEVRTRLEPAVDESERENAALRERVDGLKMKLSDAQEKVTWLASIADYCNTWARENQKPTIAFDGSSVKALVVEIVGVLQERVLLGERLGEAVDRLNTTNPGNTPAENIDAIVQALAALRGKQ